MRHGEPASFGKKAAEEYVEIFAELIEAEGYSVQLWQYYLGTKMLKIWRTIVDFAVFIEKKNIRKRCHLDVHSSCVNGIWLIHLKKNLNRKKKQTTMDSFFCKTTFSSKSKKHVKKTNKQKKLKTKKKVSEEDAYVINDLEKKSAMLLCKK